MRMAQLCNPKLQEFNDCFEFRLKNGTLTQKRTRQKDYLVLLEAEPKGKQWVINFVADIHGKLIDPPEPRSG